MARVNHKLVKQRLNEKRSKITDKQFFFLPYVGGGILRIWQQHRPDGIITTVESVNLYWKPRMPSGGNGQYADPYQHGASVGDQGQRTRESVSARVRYVCT